MSIPGKFEDQLLQELLPPSATPLLPNYLVIYVKYSSKQNFVKLNLWFEKFRFKPLRSRVDYGRRVISQPLVSRSPSPNRTYTFRYPPGSPKTTANT